jgi:hypothetical protein
MPGLDLVTLELNVCRARLEEAYSLSAGFIIVMANKDVCYSC